MDINQYLTKLFNTPIIAIKTNLGLTNDVYFFKYHTKKYVVSVPKKSIKQIIRDENYYKIIQMIKKIDIDVKEIHYDFINGIRITEYVDALTFERYQKEDKYLKAVELIKKLHHSKLKLNKEFNPYQKYLAFKSNIKKSLFNFEAYENIFLELKKINNQHYLCHNDLVAGNFLFAENKTYLIDFEYAGDNDPLFDIMSFISENEINDEKIREKIYKYYFDGKINDKIRYELAIFEQVHNLLWSCWANMMFDKTKEKKYLDILNSKILMLKRNKLK